MVDKVFLTPADNAAREDMRRTVLISPRVSSVAVGKSIMQRPIEMFTIGNGRGRVMFFGAHHAQESITCNLLFAFMHRIAMANDLLWGIDVAALFSRFTFNFVPAVNPDGIELRFHGCGNNPLAKRQVEMAGGDFSAWQANARGVDLNHNYNAGFYEYKEIELKEGIAPGNTKYSGLYPESEPETRAVANLIRTLMPAAVVSLHSQGEEIYYSPSNPKVRRIASRLGEKMGYTPALPSGSAKYGGLCDYTGSLSIPSFTVEVGRGKNPLNEGLVPEIFDRIKTALLLLPTML